MTSVSSAQRSLSTCVGIGTRPHSVGLRARSQYRIYMPLELCRRACFCIRKAVQQGSFCIRKAVQLHPETRTKMRGSVSVSAKRCSFPKAFVSWTYRCLLFTRAHVLRDTPLGCVLVATASAASAGGVRPLATAARPNRRSWLVGTLPVQWALGSCAFGAPGLRLVCPCPCHHVMLSLRRRLLPEHLRVRRRTRSHPIVSVSAKRCSCGCVGQGARSSACLQV